MSCVSVIQFMDLLTSMAGMRAMWSDQIHSPDSQRSSFGPMPSQDPTTTPPALPLVNTNHLALPPSYDSSLIPNYSNQGNIYAPPSHSVDSGDLFNTFYHPEFVPATAPIFDIAASPMLSDLSVNHVQGRPPSANSVAYSNTVAGSNRAESDIDFAEDREKRSILKSSTKPLASQTCKELSSSRSSSSLQKNRPTEGKQRTPEHPQHQATSSSAAVRQDNEGQARREKFLERNRMAASKCRARKKEWTEEVKKRSKEITDENERLKERVIALTNEVLELKGELLKHVDCNCPAFRSYMERAVSRIDANGVPRR